MSIGQIAKCVLSSIVATSSGSLLPACGAGGQSGSPWRGLASLGQTGMTTTEPAKPAVDGEDRRNQIKGTLPAASSVASFAGSVRFERR